MEQTPNEVQTDRPTLSFFTKFIGSGFFSGYTKYATGTVGSAVGLLFFLIPNFHQPYVLIPSTLALLALGVNAADKMEKIFGQDPGVVTVDEIVGMWFSLWFIPFTYLNLGIAFLIFRVLDVLKPYPAQLFDRKTGGWNIMIDDIIAAMYTNLILQISLHWL